MAWRRLPDPVEIDPDLRKKTRILVDECLGREVADFLRERSYNVVFAADVGLSGRSDEELLAHAWQDERVLWSHDRDFLDDTRFPEHRNPGVVILPGGDGDNSAMSIGVGTAALFFGFGPLTWRKTKSVISASGEITIRRRDLDTGRVRVNRYRMTRRGYAEEWIE